MDEIPIQSEPESKSNWRIISNVLRPGPLRIIVNNLLPISISPQAYNYDINTPIVLAPISKTSTLILSEYTENGKLGLRIHDLRVVEGDIVGSITLTFRGHQDQLLRFKNELNRVCDHDKCVGILFFLRKMHYGGFSTIYANKILKPKTNSTLRAAINMVTATINEAGSIDEKENG